MCNHWCTKFKHWLVDSITKLTHAFYLTKFSIHVSAFAGCLQIDQCICVLLSCERRWEWSICHQTLFFCFGSTIITKSSVLVGYKACTNVHNYIVLISQSTNITNCQKIFLTGLWCCEEIWNVCTKDQHRAQNCLVEETNLEQSKDSQQDTMHGSEYSMFVNISPTYKILSTCKNSKMKFTKVWICKCVRTYLHINPAKPNTHTYIRFLVSTTVHCMEQSRSSGTLLSVRLRSNCTSYTH